MDFVQLADKLGIPMAILFAVGVALWKILSFLGHKLFDDDKGYVPQMVKFHGDMTNRLALAGEQHVAEVRAVNAKIDKLDGGQKDILQILRSSPARAA